MLRDNESERRFTGRKNQRNVGFSASFLFLFFSFFRKVQSTLLSFRFVHWLDSFRNLVVQAVLKNQGKRDPFSKFRHFFSASLVYISFNILIEKTLTVLVHFLVFSIFQMIAIFLQHVFLLFSSRRKQLGLWKNRQTFEFYINPIYINPYSSMARRYAMQSAGRLYTTNDTQQIK